MENAKSPSLPVSRSPGLDMPLIMIGASTGGPRIVNELLSNLPSDLPAAVLVVQHIAHGFSAGMAEWLANASRLKVKLAIEGQAICVGEVLIEGYSRRHALERVARIDDLVVPARERRVHSGRVSGPVALLENDFVAQPIDDQELRLELLER